MVAPDERGTLGGLGFRKRGRHWFHDASKVAVEFPDTRIDGDEGRTERIRVGGGTAAMIGIDDDLYLDRLRPAKARLQPSRRASSSTRPSRWGRPGSIGSIVDMCLVGSVRSSGGKGASANACASGTPGSAVVFGEPSLRKRDRSGGRLDA
ncbi:MAG: hypothetical protein M3138_01215 [Actinomycetota bacterium]|nr:hypothetical protein [Actinomycetota bacterium]